MDPPPEPLMREIVGSHWRTTVAAGSLLTLHEAGEALVPVVIGAIIDRAIEDGNGAALGRWLIVLVAVFLLLSLTYRFGARLSRQLALRSTHTLRVRIVDRLLGARGAVADQLPGHILSVATSDTTRAGRAASVIAGAASSAITLLIVTVALFVTSTVVGLVVILVAPPVLILMHLCSGHLERRSADEQENAARAIAQATDLVDGLRVLKGIGGEGTAMDRYRMSSRVSLRSSLRAARSGALYGAAASGLTGVFLVAITFVAARQAAAGHITIGEMVATLGLAQLVLDPLAEVAGISASVARARASVVRVSSVLHAPPSPAGGNEAPHRPVSGEIRFDHLQSGTVEDLSLTVPAGQLLGIVAPRAADALALIDCLGRRRDPDMGSLFLDGVDVATIDPDALRVAVVVSDHEAALFEGTVLSNIEGPSSDAAIRAAAVDQVLESLPDGPDSRVSEEGRSLSGGQRQRVALARALATDAVVLVTHDPTTAVDAVTESRIADGIRSMRAGLTTIVISTSPALLSVCDRVVIIEGGVVADGDHHSLRDRDDYREAVLQ